MNYVRRVQLFKAQDPDVFVVLLTAASVFLRNYPRPSGCAVVSPGSAPSMAALQDYFVSA